MMQRHGGDYRSWGKDIRDVLERLGIAALHRGRSQGDQALSYLAGYGLYANRELYPLPNLILLDLKLRRRSGFDLLGWLRHHPGLKRIPVIVLTCSEVIEDIDRAYELGANSYLVKPLWSEGGFQDMMKIVEQYWVTYNRNPTVQDS